MKQKQEKIFSKEKPLRNQIDALILTMECLGQESITIDELLRYSHNIEESNNPKPKKKRTKEEQRIFNMNHNCVECDNELDHDHDDNLCISCGIAHYY